MSNIKIKLVSNFTDYYDHWLDDGLIANSVYRRVTTDGLNRREIFDYLTKLEFVVPRYGTVKELALKPKDLVVLHHDIQAHCGEGKELVYYDSALEEFPDVLASEYIPFDVEDAPGGIKGLSWRYLQVGVESFWIEYTSRDDWRSNYGDTKFRVFFRDKTELVPDRNYDLMLFKCPLFAIDFVPRHEQLYAVDFNIAPSCEPIKPLMQPKEAADSIRAAYILLKEEESM